MIACKRQSRLDWWIFCHLEWEEGIEDRDDDDDLEEELGAFKVLHLVLPQGCGHLVPKKLSLWSKLKTFG